MIKKVFIGIIAAGMILTTIPTVNAEDEITLDEMRGLLGDIPLGEPYGNLTITLYKAMVNRDYGINGMPNVTQGGE